MPGVCKNILRIQALALLLALPTLASADSMALILNGITNSPYHEERFAGWTVGTHSTLINSFGFNEDDVVVLNGPNAEEIQAAFEGFSERVGQDDVFFLFMIGHGSYDRGEYKFNIARADLTASDYSDLLSELGAGRSVVINATTSMTRSIATLPRTDVALVPVSRARYQERAISPIRRGSRLLTVNPIAMARNSVDRGMGAIDSVR